MLKKVVAVAMSGGVDSSMAAVLLVQQGFTVFGVTMKLWDYFEIDSGRKTGPSCCNINLVEGAKAVCAKLNLPHYVLDFTKDFKESVITDFILEYTQGHTPNPCVVCNTRVKWDVLLQKVRAMDADYLATGHYAQVEYYPRAARWILKKGLDQKRDQSYFLWGLSQDALSKTLFPIGKMTKKRVRQLAKENGLRTADAPESREICFVTDDDYRRFLKEYARVTPNPGPIIGEDGQVVGEHNGIAFYTIGQRRGLNIALGHPVYVKRIDPIKNEIHIASGEGIKEDKFLVGGANWISIAEPHQEIDCQVKIRYTAHLHDAKVRVLEDHNCQVMLSEPISAITPGQSAVFYNQDVLLAGGIIKELL